MQLAPAGPPGLLAVASSGPEAAAAALTLPPPPEAPAHSEQLAAEQQRRLELWLEQPIVLPPPRPATTASVSEATGPQAPAGSTEWWEALLLARAEMHLRRVQRQRQAFQKIVADLGLQSARVAAQIVLAATPAPAAAPSPQRPPRPRSGSLAGQTRRRSDTEAVAAVAAVVPRTATQASGHDPAACRVKNCLRCAAHARMLANLGHQAGAAAQAPLSPKQQQQQQQQQQGAVEPTTKRQLRQRRRLGTPATHTANSHAADALAGQQTAAAAQLAPEQELALAHPQLQPEVCAAICCAFPGEASLGGPQRAMAAWLASSGARSPGEVVSVLDSSQQVWGMALASTEGAGTKLVHWVALLNACKRAVGM